MSGNEFSSCPDGYKDDRWFLLELHVRQGVGSNRCTLPITAMNVLDVVLIIALFVCLILTFIRAIQEFVKVKRNKNICFLMLLSVCAIPILIVILLLRDKVSTRINLALFGVFLTPFHISALCAITNITMTIPNIFESKMTEMQKKLFAKDAMIRINIIICVTSVIVILISWSILIPLQSDETMMLVYFRIGCGANVVTIINYTLITWKSCSIIIKVIDEVSDTVRSRPISSREPAIGNDGSREKKIENARKKFILSQFEAIFGLSPCIMWIFQATIIPFYWYLVMFHIISLISYYMAMLVLYPVEWKTFKQVIYGSQKDGAALSSNKPSNPKNLRLSKGSAIISAATAWSERNGLEGTQPQIPSALIESKIDEGDNASKVSTNNEKVATMSDIYKSESKSSNFLSSELKLSE